MKHFFLRAWKDIQQHKSVELYIVLLLSIVILATDIFGITSESAFQGILLATLSILIYGLIESRHTNDEIIGNIKLIRRAINPSATLKRWQPEEISSAFSRAKKVSFLNVANFSWVEQNHSTLKTLLKTNGSIRCILVKPDSDAFHMVLNQKPDGSADADGLKMNIQLSEKLIH